MSLAACYRVESLKLLGGEPLLHSGLLDVINAVVEAGISDKVCVVTNGVLLPRMKDEFWGAVDEVWIQLPGIRTLTRTA
jgi:molybdenum cofactor biosynthesis enzyme MoaA